MLYDIVYDLVYDIVDDIVYDLVNDIICRIRCFMHLVYFVDPVRCIVTAGSGQAWTG